MSAVKRCSSPGCENTYKNHRWGHQAAQNAGWFLQRNGDSWCPDHVPEWVEQWRKNNRSRKEQDGRFTSAVQVQPGSDG